MPQGEVFTDIYADHGCSFAPSCLKCPFEVCRYDRGFAGNRVSKAQDRVERDRKIKKMRSKGMQVEHIAKACGISGRTVARILSRKGASSADTRIVTEYDEEAEAAAERARDRQAQLDAMGVKSRAPWPEIRRKSAIKPARAKTVYESGIAS